MVLLAISYFSTLVKLVNFTTLAKMFEKLVTGLHTSLHKG